MGKRRQSEAEGYHGAMRGLARRVKEAEAMADEGALVQGSIRVMYKGCKACIPPETECRGHVLAATEGGDVDTVLRALTTYLVPEAAVRAEAGAEASGGDWAQVLCECRHPRSSHEGGAHDGPCMACECPWFGRPEEAGGVVMVPEACSYCFGAMVLPSCPYCFRVPAVDAMGGDR